MTRPYREELAERLETKARVAEHDRYPVMVDPDLLTDAAAALRQSPSVEEVRAVLEDTVDAELAGPCENRAEVVAESLDAAAQAIARLWEGREGHDRGEA